MRITSTKLGELQFEVKNVITFKSGLPGFESEKEFIIVLSRDAELPFHYLQSVNNEDVTFVITNPFIFAGQYDFELSEEILSELEIKNSEEISVYAITTIPDNTENTTINLMAPVIVNNTNNFGRQVILSESWATKYYIFQNSEDEAV